LGYASVLQDDVDEASAGHVDVVLRAASQLLQIIETMLNLTYIETGEMELATEKFDLRSEVEEACETYRTMIETKELSLDVSLPEEAVMIEADRDKLRVILDNLISNSVKFTPAGGRIEVRASLQGEDAQLEVSDTGEGIPLKDRERIFDRFYQVQDHMTRRHGGMGLGLSIVKGLTEMHGGRVWVESDVGEGSRFIVRLPCQRSALSGEM
jgi:signal transduction histidine kinase